MCSPPQSLSHHDNIIINALSAEVQYAGPITTEEKKRWDGPLEFRDLQQEEVSYFAQGYRDARKPGSPTQNC
jgi:hypothetical protein